MPRFSALARASVAAALVAVALAGCTQAPTAVPTSGCGGLIKKVLLADDSATNVASFNAADVPKIFAVSASPAPSCYYVTTTSPPAINGVDYTVTHRTLVYIGVSDAQTKAIVAAVRATVGAAPWAPQYDDGVPAAASATPAPTAAAVPASYAGLWLYNFGGAATDDTGSMGYYVAAPVTAGTAQDAGLSGPVNVVRVETELRQPKK